MQNELLSRGQESQYILEWTSISTIRQNTEHNALILGNHGELDLVGPEYVGQSSH